MPRFRSNCDPIAVIVCDDCVIIFTQLCCRATLELRPEEIITLTTLRCGLSAPRTLPRPDLCSAHAFNGEVVRTLNSRSRVKSRHAVTVQNALSFFFFLC